MDNRVKYIDDNGVKVNCTTLFLLPIYDMGGSDVPDEFISAYILDKLKPKIILCFENEKNDKFIKFIESLRSNENFIKEELDGENELVVYMNIPKKFHIDFNLFKIGRWSKLSNDLKNLLLTKHGRKTGAGKYISMIDALFPDANARKVQADICGVDPRDLPNGEVFQIPNLDNELYCKISELNKPFNKRKYE